MRRWVVGAMIVGVVGLVGCGSSKPAATAPASTAPASTADVGVKTVSPTSRPAGMTSAQIRPELLTVADLPTGWSTTPVTSSGGSGFCGADSTTKDDSSGSVESDFVDGQEPIFNESIVAYPALSVPSFNKAVGILDRCTSVQDSGTRLTVGRLSFPTIGTASAAYQFSGSDEGFTLDVDLVLARKGNQVLLIGYGGIGDPDITQLTSFARQAAAKLP
jgi:hypothetical protein